MKVRIIFSSLIILALAGCKSTAFVTCNNIDKFESSSGVINTPFFNIGDLVVIDTLRKTGSYIGHIDIAANELAATNPMDDYEIISKTDFTISLSGKIVKDVDLALTAKNSINNSSMFYLKNSIRKETKDPVSKMDNAPLKPTILKTLKTSQNSIVMLVAALVYAEEIKLNLSKEMSTSVDVNTIKIGKINLQVNYSCEDALNAIATQNKGSGVFYKGTFFQLNSNQSDLIFLTKGPSLRDYNLVHGIRTP